MKEFSSKILDIKKLAEDVFHISLEAPPNFSFIPGQFISLLITVDGKELRRPYSIASINQEKIELCVKNVGGPASQIFSHAKKGDSLRFIGPMGRFTLPEAQDLVFISTGVGIAPFRAMIAQAISEGRNITLIAGYRYKNSILYHEEFLKYHNNFKYYVCLSKPEDNVFPKGHVQDLLKEIPSNFKGKILICGVYEMIQDVINKLLEKGFRKEQIITERFT